MGARIFQASTETEFFDRIGVQRPLAIATDHDINYIALTGTLHAIGQFEDPPIVPLTLIGDFGAGVACFWHSTPFASVSGEARSTFLQERMYRFIMVRCVVCQRLVGRGHL